MLNGLSLFTGIGGLDVALSDWVRPIAYCEIDPYCQGVLFSRMADGLLPNCPIWDDVKTLQGTDFRGNPDIIYGGFPCQDISIARNGKGLAGERSGLCYEIFRLSNEIKPRWLFLENVPAITTRGGLEVVTEITKMGYDCRWITITASSVGALHKRERWFLLAHAKGERFKEERQPLRKETKQSRFDSNPKYEASNQRKESPSPFLGMDDDVPRRMDRVKALGNSVVPAQAREAFRILSGLA